MKNTRFTICFFALIVVGICQPVHGAMKLKDYASAMRNRKSLNNIFVAVEGSPKKLRQVLRKKQEKRNNLPNDPDIKKRELGRTVKIFKAYDAVVMHDKPISDASFLSSVLYDKKLSIPAREFAGWLLYCKTDNQDAVDTILEVNPAAIDIFNDVQDDQFSSIFVRYTKKMHASFEIYHLFPDEFTNGWRLEMYFRSYLPAVQALCFQKDTTPALAEVLFSDFAYVSTSSSSLTASTVFDSIHGPKERPVKKVFISELLHDGLFDKLAEILQKSPDSKSLINSETSRSIADLTQRLKKLNQFNDELHKN